MSDIGYHCFPFTYSYKVVEAFVLFVQSVLVDLFATKS